MNFCGFFVCILFIVFSFPKFTFVLLIIHMKTDAPGTDFPEVIWPPYLDLKTSVSRNQLANVNGRSSSDACADASFLAYFSLFFFHFFRSYFFLVFLLVTQWSVAAAPLNALGQTPTIYNNFVFLNAVYVDFIHRQRNHKKKRSSEPKT